MRRIQGLQEAAASAFNPVAVRRPVSPVRPPRAAQPVTPDPEPPQDYVTADRITAKSPVTPDEAFPDGPPSPKEPVKEESKKEPAEEEQPLGSTMFAMFPLQE